jgi:hypothetical protein
MNSISPQNVVTAASADPYVLPAPPRPVGSLIIGEPGASERLSQAREAAVGRAIGERFVALLDCQQRFFGELRATLLEMDDAVADESRARMKNQIRVLGEILDWCEAVHVDLEQECRQAIAGRRPIDLLVHCELIAAEFVGGRSGVQVDVHGAAQRPWWGDPSQFSALVDAALNLVAERIGGQGSIAVEIGEGTADHRLRVFGNGEPHSLPDSDAIDRFRRAAKELGASVRPDDMGVGGAGLVLLLPAATPAAS